MKLSRPLHKQPNAPRPALRVHAANAVIQNLKDARGWAKFSPQVKRRIDLALSSAYGARRNAERFSHPRRDHERTSNG